MDLALMAILLFIRCDDVTKIVQAQNRGNLIFEENFNTLDLNRWQHLITGWRGGNNEFQYYTNRPENR